MESTIKSILETASKQVYLPKVGKYSFKVESEFYKYLENIEILLDNGLLIKMKDDEIKITGHGRKVLKENSIDEHLALVIKDRQRKKEKEELEYEKTTVDLKLAKETLKEFPRTKWFARISLIISIILLIKEIYVLLN